MAHNPISTLPFTPNQMGLVSMFIPILWCSRGHLIHSPIVKPPRIWQAYKKLLDQKQLHDGRYQVGVDGGCGNARYGDELRFHTCHATSALSFGMISLISFPMLMGTRSPLISQLNGRELCLARLGILGVGGCRHPLPSHLICWGGVGSLIYDIYSIFCCPKIRTDVAGTRVSSCCRMKPTTFHWDLCQNWLGGTPCTEICSEENQ